MANGLYEPIFTVQFHENNEIDDAFAIILNDADDDRIFVLDKEEARELMLLVLDYLDTNDSKVKKVAL